MYHFRIVGSQVMKKFYFQQNLTYKSCDNVRIENFSILCMCRENHRKSQQESWSKQTYTLHFHYLPPTKAPNKLYLQDIMKKRDSNSVQFS